MSEISNSEADTKPSITCAGCGEDAEKLYDDPYCCPPCRDEAEAITNAKRRFPELAEPVQATEPIPDEADLPGPPDIEAYRRATISAAPHVPDFIDKAKLGPSTVRVLEDTTTYDADREGPLDLGDFLPSELNSDLARLVRADERARIERDVRSLGYVQGASPSDDTVKRSEVLAAIRGGDDA